MVNSAVRRVPPGPPSGPQTEFLTQPIAKSILPPSISNGRDFAPIRSQKSKYFLRGRPNSVEFLKGCPYPRCNDASMPGLPCRGYQRFDARLNRWACTDSCRRCADGASDLRGINLLEVFFCHHRTPESCLENAPVSSHRLRFGLCSDSVAFSLVRGRSRRPCTYRGLFQGRSIKIIERS